jgi:hypothetical protein
MFLNMWSVVESELLEIENRNQLHYSSRETSVYWTAIIPCGLFNDAVSTQNISHLMVGLLMKDEL